jgi:hypothetical protein
MTLLSLRPSASQPRDRSCSTVPDGPRPTQRWSTRRPSARAPGPQFFTLEDFARTSQPHNTRHLSERDPSPGSLVPGAFLPLPCLASLCSGPAASAPSGPLTQGHIRICPLPQPRSLSPPALQSGPLWDMWPPCEAQWSTVKSSCGPWGRA